MANVQDMKAEKAVKALRLFTVLLLVVGIVALAAPIVDMVTGHKLLTSFGAKADQDTNFGGISVAYVMLMAAGALLILGSVMQLVKGNYRLFQGTCIAAIIFSLFPLICFAVNIGVYLFALIYALLALAIIVLAIFAMKSRWQVYIKEMTGEVKKLTWLNMKELVKATAVVLVFVLAFALLIYVLDLIFNLPIKALLTPKATATQSTTDTDDTTTDDTTTDDTTTDDTTTDDTTTDDTTTDDANTDGTSTEDGTENN